MHVLLKGYIILDSQLPLLRSSCQSAKLSNFLCWFVMLFGILVNTVSTCILIQQHGCW